VAWSVALGLLLGLSLIETGGVPGRISKGRVYRVGADHSPPFYEVQPDGSVTGLAVDVVNEAARRRGIRLEWIVITEGLLDDALLTRRVDLWPLVGPTKLRQQEFFLSKPWLENDYVLLSRSSLPIRNPSDAAGYVVAHAKLMLTTAIAHQYLPRSKLLVLPHRDDAVHAVCLGEAAAALVESRVLDAILLERPGGCSNQIFRISTLSGARSPLSIAAVPEAHDAAEALRNEITALAREGALGAMLDEWSPFSAQGTTSIWARETAEQHSLIYRGLFRVILVFAVILCVIMRRALQLKKLAQAGKERYRHLVHQQQQTLAELRASEQRWQLALKGAGDGLWDWDLTTNVVYRSPAWKTMLGYRDDEIGNTTEDWRRLVHSEDADRVLAALDSHLKHETVSFSCDYRMLAKDEGWRWVSDRGQAVWDGEGTAIRIAGSQTDITARVAEQEALSLEARTDSLTSLWNRREFDRALPVAIKSAQDGGQPLALCLFDLNDFKMVNDSFGHAAGDQVLAAFGSLLQENSRRRDICCRMGGDEFVAILPDTPAEDAKRLATRVCSEFRDIRFTSAGGTEFRVKCSFGVGESTVEDPLAMADAQLYQVKVKTGPQRLAALGAA